MPLFPEQIARNKVILSSINRLGLTSRKAASVTSVSDSFHQNLLCFNGFPVDRNFEKILEALSFNETSGFWAIAIEGTGISVSNLDIEKINAALQNAIVFVFELTPAIKQRCAKDNVLIFQHRGLITTDSESEISHHEYRTTQTIAPQNIAAILVPQHLVSQVTDEFPGQRIIPVKDFSQKILVVPWMATDVSKKKTLIISSNEMMTDILSRNNVLKTPVQLTGPDFSQGLRELVAALSDIKELGVHLTRLVTPAMCQSRKLKIANCEVENVTKSYRQEHRLIKLELTNISASQLDFISSHPGISISKNYLKKNCYTVICPAQYKDLLATVIKDMQHLHSQAAVIQNAFKNYARRKAQKLYSSTFFTVRNDKLMRAQNEMHALVVNQEFVSLQDAAQKAQAIKDEISDMNKLATDKPIAALRALR